jgi:hypothetical protein
MPEAPPARQTFHYDFPAYFKAAFAGERPTLQKNRFSLVFTKESPEISLPDYARETVWYGRRKGLGRKGLEIIYG